VARTALADCGPDVLGLEFYEDLLPRGPAGCARDAALATPADTFVVADGTVIPTVALADVLKTHRDSGAMATVVVEQDSARGLADGFARPGGIYVFERPALEMVSDKGFQDIKENLIPQIYRTGGQVVAHVAARGCHRVLNAATYLDANQWAIARLLGAAPPDGYAAHGDALVHSSAFVDRRARILGPVLVGPDAKVMSGATVIGPVVLGAGSTVAVDAVVARSVTWSRCLVSGKAVVDGCVLADDAIVPDESHLCGDVVVPARRAEDLSRVLRERMRRVASFGLWPRPEAR
jgi:NDP-sugar pyrophosphorylase family protein